MCEKLPGGRKERGWRRAALPVSVVRVFKALIICAAVASVSGAPAKRLADLAATDFWRESALDARIEVAAFDREFMALAIFHETNRVRERLRLPLFQFLPRLNEAADLEAAVGRVYQPPSHTNPFPMIGTPLQRVKYVGLNPGFVAENIALLSIYDVASGAGVGVALREGKRRIVHPETHTELRPATYRGFAAAVVQAWMESPGHRVNIVSPEFRHLGCSVQPTVSLLGVDQLFCVQVFFTPRD